MGRRQCDHFTPEDVVRVYRETGGNQTETGRRLGITHTSVAYWLRTVGEPIRKPKRFTPAQLRKLRYLHTKKGWSGKRCAEHFGMSGVATVRHLKKMGVYKSPYTVITPDEIVCMYAEKRMSIRTIAKRVRASQTRISRILRASGIEPDGRSVRLGIDPKEVARLYSSGLTSTQVGSRLGASGRYVLSVLNKEGIQVRAVGPKPMLVEHTSEIIRLYTEKRLSSAEIARRFGCGYSIVLALLKQNNVAIRQDTGRVHYRRFRPVGCMLSLGSSWEGRVYSLLFRSRYSDTFLFQGEVDRADRRAPVITLKKPKRVRRRYCKGKATYSWRPDFVLPSQNVIIEVKGSFHARNHWDAITLPCIRFSVRRSALPYKVYALYKTPRPCRNWKELRQALVRVA